MLYCIVKRRIFTLTHTPNKHTHPLGQPNKQNTPMNKCLNKPIIIQLLCNTSGPVAFHCITPTPTPRRWENVLVHHWLLLHLVLHNLWQTYTYTHIHAPIYIYSPVIKNPNHMYSYWETEYTILHLTYYIIN